MKILSLIFFFFKIIRNFNLRDKKIFLIKNIFWLISYALLYLIFLSFVSSYELEVFSDKEYLIKIICGILKIIIILDLQVTFYFQETPTKNDIKYLNSFNVSDAIVLPSFLCNQIQSRVYVFLKACRALILYTAVWS